MCRGNIIYRKNIPFINNAIPHILIDPLAIFNNKGSDFLLAFQVLVL